MSRTIRRKRAHQEWLYVRAPEKIDEWDLLHWGASSVRECQVRQSAWFHRDHHNGLFGVPHWYRHINNDRFKRQNSRELHRCKVQGDWDDHLAFPYLRDAGYFWW